MNYGPKVLPATGGMVFGTLAGQIWLGIFALAFGIIVAYAIRHFWRSDKELGE